MDINFNSDRGGFFHSFRYYLHEKEKKNGENMVAYPDRLKEIK